MQSDSADRRLTDRADVKRFLRRLAFGSAAALESVLTGRTVDEALDERIGQPFEVVL